MSQRRSSIRAKTAVTATMLLLPLPGGWSQTVPAPISYPIKVVRIVNPVAPGGNQDIIARVVAEHMTRAFGQPVVIESRPGASAIVGTRFVKSAPPDGYTLLAISNTFVRTPALTTDAGYDPINDFAGISLTGDVPLVLVVNPALPVKSVQELIALAKRRPGELTSAASGIGSTGHVATEMFCRQAGIRMLHVQYKGAAPAVVDLVGGHVMLRFDQVSTSLPHIRSGKLRALGVSTRKRSPALPDGPTIEEGGLPGFQDFTFNGLIAPAGTPREIVVRLNAELNKIIAAPDMKQRLIDNGFEPVGGTPEQFAAYIREDFAKWTQIVKDANVKVE